MSAWPPILVTPTLQLGILPLLGFALLQCLVAIWAATSGRHWLLRACCVWVGILLVVLISAWDAAWLFTLSSLLIVLVLPRLDGLRPRPAATAPAGPTQSRPFQIGVRDLFGILLLAGLWISLALEVVRNHFPSNIVGWLVSSCSLAAIAVLCRVAAWQPRAWSIGLLVCSIPVCAAATWFAGDWMYLWSNVGVDLFKWPQGLAGLTLVGVEFAFFLISLLVLRPTAWLRQRSLGWRIAQVSLWGAILLVLAIPTGMVYWALAQPLKRPTKYATPSENQYPRIVAIAEEVQRLNPGELSLADLKAATPAPQTTQQVEAHYAELLPLLAGSNAAAYDPDRDAVAEYSPPLQLLRSLARTLKAEGESLQATGQSDRAADFAVANIRLGTMWRRGGIVDESLLGNAIQSIGLAQLAQLRAELSPERSRVAIADLRRALSEHEDFESLLAREFDYQRRAFGWQFLLDDVGLPFQLGMGTNWLTGLSEAIQKGDTTNRLVQADLAIRLYQHEHDRLPSDLQALVPDFLLEVPIDPYSLQPLKYRPEGQDFVLYSVGFDGRDDGGSSGGPTAYNNAGYGNHPGLDFDLDTLWP